jgi:hypothetical protein
MNFPMIKCASSRVIGRAADRLPGSFLNRRRRAPARWRRDVAIFAACLVLLALLSQQSYAQTLPESERQKAQEERKQEEQKANDEAYKAMIKRTPSSNKKVDPWGSLRAAPVR